ncbi:MarR family winged helix-turn-helix transcriptional regulator [Leptospira noguchii]|uniref:MarR family transcriptional regulator n=1 Tax=Leptospira noguchii TaxID=28182 RepID=A0AAE9KB57_9LEPT|nr:MarR family transcriptional regulator [Leptospira noguchii]EKR72277.1 MarR family protein [Leptospira noguchii str. 2006001870]UOG34848.1 MarR family transcriptional regulator [Leptospira noguchii]UOG42178.1 MarR family transcriptional regulator [Leptospira noguchii]UOG45746.1 MarR family transcriptional regulator [Leptospira noguchii]UOG49433.1 MarR family transcriptional regulator [Leptospira noguchii]
MSKKKLKEKKISKKTFSVNKAEDSSGFLLWQVTSLWQRGIQKVLSPLDLTHSQFVLLASMYWLQLHMEDVTQVKLSRHTKIDPMTTSSVLRTLQSKKLILRREHSTDTRAKIVELTEVGKKVTQKAVKLVETFDSNFFTFVDNEIVDFNLKLNVLIENNFS